MLTGKIANRRDNQIAFVHVTYVIIAFLGRKPITIVAVQVGLQELSDTQIVISCGVIQDQYE